MGLFDQFPYTNFHELNLDWILKALKELEHTIEQFVAINALKYADPIQWNIVSQYEKNTIVIDPQTGTAYISVQPVPSGVIITNTDYWTVVFDLGAFVVRASKNFAAKYEDATTLTATFPSSVNDWIIWGDVLYKVISPIVAGDQYVVDSNIKHFTMENIIGHLEDLTTTDKSNLVAAINEVLQKLINTAGDLDDLNTTDKSNLVAAINEVLQQLSDTAGDLDDLTTDDKSNLVAAINENFNTIKTYKELLSKRKILHSRDYGAVGDGVTDDTLALQSWCDAADRDVLLFLDGGTYHTTAPLNIKSNTFMTAGELGSATFIDQFVNGTLNIIGDIVWISLIDFGASAGATGCCINGSNNHALNLYKCQLGGQSYAGASSVTFLKENGNFYNIIMDNCLIDGGGQTGYAIYFNELQSATPTDIIIRNCFIDNYLATTGGVLYLNDVTDCWITNSIMRSLNNVITIKNTALQPTYSFNWLIQCSIDCLTSGSNIFSIDPFCALYTNSYIVDRGATVDNRGVYSLYDSANTLQLPMMGKNIFIPEAPMTETYAANTGRQTLWFTSTPNVFTMFKAWASFTTQYSRIKLSAIAQTLGFSYGIGLKNVAGEILFMRYDFFLNKIYVELYNPDGTLNTTLFEESMLFTGHYFAITHVSNQQFIFSISNNGSDYYDLGQYAFEENPQLGIIGVNSGSNTVNPNKITVESSYLY